MTTNVARTRLLFYVNVFLAGGIEKVLLELLQALDHDRYEVVLLIGHYLGSHEVLRKDLPPGVKVEYVLSSPLLTWARRKRTTARLNPVGKFLDETFLTYFKRRAHRRLITVLSGRADVIIDFDMTLSPYIGSASGARTAAYCHFSFAHYWDGRKSKLQRLAGRLAQYDTVVMLCEEMMRDAIADYPVLQGKAVRIYNALDRDSIFARSQEERAGAAEHPAGSYIVSVGRLQESQKDFSTLIRAYAIAVKKGLGKKLVLVGGGGSLDQLRALAKEEGVADRVHFTGFLPNPYPWMAGAAMFVFSSRYEGLPTVLIEAQMLGLPIVSTRTPTGAAELLGDGGAGTLTPVGDAEALAQAMLDLLEDDVRQAAYRKAAETILSAFTPGHMVREFERLVLGNARPETA